MNLTKKGKRLGSSVSVEMLKAHYIHIYNVAEVSQLAFYGLKRVFLGKVYD